MSSLTRRSLQPTAVAATIGVLLGLGLGMAVSGRMSGSVLVAVLGCGVVALAAYRVSPPQHRGFVLSAVMLAFALRVAVAAVLHGIALAMGRSGAVTGDDGAYADLAWAYVQYLRGEGQPPDLPPIWNGQAYLFGTFVYLESAVFWFLGRDMLAMQFLNAMLAALGYVALFDMGRRFFGERAGRMTLALVALYPSLILWSSLNLKEAFVVTAVTVVLWYLARTGPSIEWLGMLGSYALIQALQSMRSYSFMGLLAIVPLSVLFTPFAAPRRRVTAAVVALSLSWILLAVSPWLPFATDLGYALENLDIVRRAQAESARTAFVAPRPVAVAYGDTLYVPTPEPVSSPAPTQSPTVHYVQPGTRVVLGTPAPSAGTGPEIYVRPGDVVVVGSPDMTPAPISESRRITFVDQRGGAQSATLDIAPTPRSEPEALVLRRTLEHIPSGLAHAILAPFPWEVKRPGEAILLPEMLVWLALLVAAARTVWARRQDWRRIAPVILYLAGVLALFSLVEGNTGTLHRHRSMLIPYVVLLASPTLLLGIDRWRQRRS